MGATTTDLTLIRRAEFNGLGALVLAAALVHLMILTEEEHLRAVHGDEFARYCQRLPRYLSFRRSG